MQHPLTIPALTIHHFRDFSDPGLTPQRWQQTLKRSQYSGVFMSWHWQKAWWDTFGRGELLLLGAERDGELVAIAPLFADAEMIFFVGSGGSDYLDFVGDVSDPKVLSELLQAAKSAIPNCLGFRFYHLPDSSASAHYLRSAAASLGLTIFEEDSQQAPVLALAQQPDAAVAATRKKSLLRHENWFRREGDLSVEHLTLGDDIRPHLDAFFEQHISRWAEKDSPSLFNDPTQRAFYVRLTEVANDTGWLRFTRIVWRDQPIAFHFGFSYAGCYLWYKPSFDIKLASHSPGEVLLRQLILAAISEAADSFDFGLGDETFKHRFATQINSVSNWGLYPKSSLIKTNAGTLS